MDEFGFSDDSGGEEENASVEADRKEQMRKREAEIAIIRKQKIEQAAETEARIYPKQMKMMRLGECLEQQQYLMNTDRRKGFLDFIPEIMDLFENDEAFAIKINRLGTAEMLRKYLKTWYDTNLDPNTPENDTPEKQVVHEWLAKYGKEVMDALHVMGNIPKDPEISEFDYNIFPDLQEEAVHRANSKIVLDEITEKLRIRQDAEKQVTKDSIVDLFNSLHIGGVKEDVINELQEIATLRINSRGRDTSPVRVRASGHSVANLIEKLSPFVVSTPGGQQVREEVEEVDPFYEVMFATSEEQSTEDGGGDSSVSQYAQKTREAGSANALLEVKEEVESDTSDSEEQSEIINEIKHGNWRRILDFKERPHPVHFNKASIEKQNEKVLSRFENKHTKKKVKFVVFDSPKNTMRIFVKPNGWLYNGADDGPFTDYTDLTLAEGRFALRKTELPFTAGQKASPSDPRCGIYKHQGKLVYFDDKDWLQGYHGNLLGRFWFQNEYLGMSYEERIAEDNKYSMYDISRHKKLCLHGLLRQYNEDDLKIVYGEQLQSLYDKMRHGLSRVTHEELVPKGDQVRTTEKRHVSGVLFLTDWRLLFAIDRAFVNAFVQYMPTNIGDAFFLSMTEYLMELIRDPNIEFHTIIFAFGGSPLFTKEAFLKFWKQLVVQTTKCIDVIWTAQDWCAGLRCSEEEQEYLDDFNFYVEKAFESMRCSGHRNYKWCNIRKQYKIRDLKDMKYNFHGKPDIDLLQDLYFSYFDFFTRECDFYSDISYFCHVKEKNPNYTENGCRHLRHFEERYAKASE